MNPILTALLATLGKDKGRDVNRTLVLAGVAWCAYQLTLVERRVANIETRLSIAQVATVQKPSSTNFFDLGPDWPRQSAAAYQPHQN